MSATWELVPCLDTLRAETNAIAPSRSKTSDGTIGDTAHQQRQSDHNDDEVGNVPIRDADGDHEVHALDLDKDLNTPGLTMERIVQHVLALCRAGDRRLRYVIYRRRIWAADNGWREEPYTGDNPHEEHAHFSSSYVTAQEARKDTWHLKELNVPESTPAEIADAVWDADLDLTAARALSARGGLLQVNDRVNEIHKATLPNIVTTLNSVADGLETVQNQLDTVEGKLDAVLAKLGAQ